MGLAGVKHAEGHLRYQAGVVVALKAQAEVLQTLRHHSGVCPASFSSRVSDCAKTATSTESNACQTPGMYSYQNEQG